MRRNATLKLESFDPDVLDAARDVAQRAGIPLEAWLESVMAGEPKPDGRRRKRSAPPEAAPPAATAPPRSAPHRTEPPRPETRHAGPPAMPPAPPRQAVPAFPRPSDFPPVGPSDVFGPSIVEMMRRLDALDRSLAEERKASAEAAARAFEEIEGRIVQALDAKGQGAKDQGSGGQGSGGQGSRDHDAHGIEKDGGVLADRLAEIERKLGELNANLAAPRPMGRRGRPLAEEVRDAVEEVRLRQRQLESGGEPGDVRLALLGAEAAAPSPAIAELQAETSRLRESLGGLATGRDVSALEQAMRMLVTDVKQARKPSDLAAVAAPIESLREQVERLADDVAENVHARVSQQVERLASKVDGVLSATPASFADRDALDGLFRELDEVRRQIAALAGPERIQSLAQGLHAISQQVAQLQKGMAGEGPRVAELKPLLEEIRRDMKAPEASRAILGKIDALADKVDRVSASPIGDLVTRLERISESLRQNTVSVDGRAADLKPLLEEIRRDVKAPEASRAILGKIDALADKMDRVNVPPVGELIGRLDRIGESLRQPQVQPGDVAAIQRMLDGLAEKVDRVGAAAGVGGLDAIEKQVVAISRRLESRSSDPAIGKLELMMADLLNEVAEMRNQAPIEAIVESATRRAVAETATGGSAGGIDRLRSDFAEMCAQQAAADQRMQSTMSNLNAALEKLVDRLGAPAPVARPAAEDGRAIADRLMASSLPIPPMSGSEPGPKIRTRRPEADRDAEAAPHTASLASDELLEPGAGRPDARRAPPREPSAAAPASGDIKTSFIAAARRAAQAAQADLDTPAVPEPRSERIRGRAPAPSQSEPAAASSLISRLRASMDKRRRHLLLGLAAVVLALGAIKVVEMGGADAPSIEPALASLGSASEAKPPEPAPIDLAAQAPAAKDPAAKDSSVKDLSAKASSAKVRHPDPATTHSLGAPDLAEASAQDAAEPVAKPSAVSAATASVTAPEAGKEPAAPASLVPKVASMASLKADLAGLPTGLASLRQAALEGDGAAIFELAVRHADGRGMPRDLGLAAKLYEKVAAAGYAPAQFKLGSFHEKGQGVIRDLGQAKYWYGRAAEQGNIRAMHNLAVLHAENPSATGKPDFATASSWFRRAAEYGVRDSQYNLAVLYARGLGLNQDLVQSYAWFAAAAAQGDEEAGRKRDDVAVKMAPKDLASAKAVAAAFKPKLAEPAANETPAVKASGPAPMSLIGAPPPGGGFQAPKRAGAAGV